MTKKAERIVTEALERLPQIRAYVAEKLIESLDIDTAAELSTEWKAEIKKRCREVDEETVELKASDAVLDRAFKMSDAA